MISKNKMCIKGRATPWTKCFCPFGAYCFDF